MQQGPYNWPANSFDAMPDSGAAAGLDQQYPFGGTPSQALSGLGQQAPMGAPQHSPLFQTQQAPLFPFQQANGMMHQQANGMGEAVPYGSQPHQVQPQHQTQYQAQPQAAPIAPVSCPVYTPTPQTNATPSPQQTAQRSVVNLARTLEQAIPGYQIMVSVLHDLRDAPRGQTLTGLDPLIETLRDLTLHQYSALGAIRRFLCGEATGEVLTSLTAEILHLDRLHRQLRPQFERFSMAATPDLRGIVMGLSQIVTTADGLIKQSSVAAQSTVGSQIWETARSRMPAAKTASGTAGLSGATSAPGATQ